MRTFLISMLIVVLILFGPLITIWALNTMFPVLAIPYSWETWLAVVVLSGLFKTTISKS